MTKLVVPAQVFTYNGIATNLYRANQGEGLPRHDHTFSHLTMCVAGRTVIRKDGLEREMGPQDPPISLRENEWHEIEALEDGTIFINMFAA